MVCQDTCSWEANISFMASESFLSLVLDFLKIRFEHLVPPLLCSFLNPYLTSPTNTLLRFLFDYQFVHTNFYFQNCVFWMFFIYNSTFLLKDAFFFSKDIIEIYIFKVYFLFSNIFLLFILRHWYSGLMKCMMIVSCLL